jgi:hypothetical protein
MPESLNVLVERASKGEIQPRFTPRRTILSKIPFWKEQQPDDDGVLLPTIVSISESIKDLQKAFDEIGDEISPLRTKVSGIKPTDPNASELGGLLKKIADLTVAQRTKKDQIELLTKQLASLTGTNVLIAERDLVLSNFSVIENFYIRASGSVTLDSPVRSQLLALDQSLRPGLPIQPGDTALFSITLMTKETVLFRPVQYQLQYSLNFSFDPERKESRTGVCGQVVTIRSPIGSVMLGSILGGVLGYIAHFLQQPTAHSTTFWKEFGLCSLTIILSAISVVFLARKSDAQSMVSVEDFWGGVVIGFLIGYSGTSAFQGIAGNQGANR